MSLPTNAEILASRVYSQERQAPNPFIQERRPIVIVSPSSHHPEPCICPFCHQSIVTRVEKSNGAGVWLLAAGICILGFILGCCLIPFCVDGIKDTIHYCPNCHRIIGRKKRL